MFGNVYFKDGHVEEMLTLSGLDEIGPIYFSTITGHYTYNEELESMKLPLGDGRTCSFNAHVDKYHIFVPSENRYVPTYEIDRIEIYYKGEE